MAGGRKNGKNGNFPWWGWLIGFIVLTNVPYLWWLLPLAVFWVVFRNAKSGSSQDWKNISSDARQAARTEKYLIMTEGRNVESIEYLASAVGVSYDTALRDLQVMVSEGRFGPDAYINYVDRSLVIPVSGARPAAGSAPKSRPSGGAEGSNMVSRAAESDAKKKAASAAAGKKEKDGSPRRSVESDKSDDRLRTILLIVGILLIGFGILRLGTDSALGIVSGVLTALGGVGALGFRWYLKKRENRFKFYEAACVGRDYVTFEELSRKAGISPRKCRRELEVMLEKGFLPGSAYIDNGEGALILTPGAAPKAKAEPVTRPEEDNEDRYKAILKEIRKLNDEIPDEDVSRRIDEMEALTGRIFAAVREKPEKEPQIKSFMSYYLPTTLKLLHSYADFERSGAQGENIRNAKAEIERILDTLVDGFRKQLDKLYETEAMDISSDIDVLETMLRRDGLSSDGSAFQTKKE